MMMMMMMMIDAMATGSTLRVGRNTTAFERRERWVLLKIPRCDIDGVGEGK